MLRAEINAIHKEAETLSSDSKAPSRPKLCPQNRLGEA